MNTETSQPVKSRFISLRVRILIGFTVLFTVVFAATYFWFLTFSTQAATERVTEEFRVLLVSAAKQIDGDAFVRLYSEAKPNADGLSDDPRYQTHLEFLQSLLTNEVRVQNAATKSYAYTFIESKKPGEVIVVGDSSVLDNLPDQSKFLEPYTDPAGLLPHGLQQTTIADQLYSNDNGTWFSGATPIRDSAGKIVGGLALDYAADYVINLRRSILSSIFVAFVLSYGTLFILVFFASQWLSRPLAELSRIAAQIGEGNYSHDLSHLHKKRFHDEISKLAHVFEIMESKVGAREKQLQAKVSQLEIVIDQRKRDKQIESITESEFFKDLQSRADEMRARRKAQEEA